MSTKHKRGTQFFSFGLDPCRRRKRRSPIPQRILFLGPLLAVLPSSWPYFFVNWKIRRRRRDNDMEHKHYVLVSSRTTMKATFIPIPIILDCIEVMTLEEWSAKICWDLQTTVNPVVSEWMVGYIHMSISWRRIALSRPKLRWPRNLWYNNQMSSLQNWLSNI